MYYNETQIQTGWIYRGQIMDMGDILEQWEKVKKAEKIKAKEAQKETQKIAQISHKKANAPTKEEKEIHKATSQEEKETFQAKVNPMEVWLRKYGTIDKDKIAQEHKERSREQDRNYLLNMKPEAYLDLHGLHQEEARQQLDAFITNCKNRGLRKVMIIHGKGIHTHGTDPVLGELVRRFIEIDRRCGTSGHPKNKAEGGSGATWIILK